MGNCCGQPIDNKGVKAPRRDPDSPVQLAKETYFTKDEVHALHELYKHVSNSLHKDGVIQKDEFMQALFHTQPGQPNLFADRLFKVFDLKQNNIIEFGEFVRALSVFHPQAPLKEKALFAFRVYDLDNTGDIQPGEVKRLLVALLHGNPEMALDDATIEQIVDQTFEEADLAKDGRISYEEWLVLVNNNPAICSWMTLPVLKDVTLKYPSFIFNHA
mmetsp:Transcript_13970/g.42137  ORF Transcript_13970/g.42137 Transcript_13970/m.42137 type:complete len:216 (+) Transcript_13970:131-778(+)